MSVIPSTWMEITATGLVRILGQFSREEEMPQSVYIYIGCKYYSRRYFDDRLTYGLLLLATSLRKHEGHSKSMNSVLMVVSMVPKSIQVVQNEMMWQVLQRTTIPPSLQPLHHWNHPFSSVNGRNNNDSHGLAPASCRSL